MKLKKLQKLVQEIIELPETTKVAVPLLWTSEEAGEILKIFKSSLKSAQPINTQELHEEIGDTLIALVALINGVGEDLDDIVEDALEKWENKWEAEMGT